MSKSNDNFIDIFLPDKKLRKQIMGIKTDSTPMEDPKVAEDCNVFKLFTLLASEEESAIIKAKYEEGNFGYGHAKQELFELICEKYKTEREKFYAFKNKNIIDTELAKGAQKARVLANEVLNRVRENIGY